MSNLRLATGEVSESNSKAGRFLAPSKERVPAEALSHLAGDPEAGGQPRARPHLTSCTKIIVHALEEGLLQLVYGGVVGVLCDGNDADALAPEIYQNTHGHEESRDRLHIGENYPLYGYEVGIKLLGQDGQGRFDNAADQFTQKQGGSNGSQDPLLLDKMYGNG